MCPRQKLALVIPTLREAESLRALLPRARAVLEGLEIGFEILVVDDDSGDGTEGVVGEIAGEDPRVRLLIRRGERGLAGAILHGWQNSDAGIVGVMDADGQHPAELLAELLAAMERGCDVAIASRYAKTGRWGGWNPLRRLISAASIRVTRPLLRDSLRVADPLSGYFLVRRACLEGTAFRPAGFKLLLEILVRGQVRSACEVPFEFGRRGAGRSKAGIKVAWDYVLLLARLYRAEFGQRWRGEGAIAEEAGSG